MPQQVEINGEVNRNITLEAEIVLYGGSGTNDYEQLVNLPKVNGVELKGNKTTEDLGINIPAKTSDLDNDSGFVNSSIVANPYDATSTYAVGAYVTHDNNLYKCNTAITTAEEWNAEHWTLVDVISAIPTKTSELDNDSGFVTIDDTNKTSDKTWSSQKISDELIAILPTGTESGTVASFKTSLALPLVDCTIDVSATKIYQLGSNFFDKNAITAGSLINGAGNEVSYADWNVSDFVPVIEGASYYLYGLTNRPNTQQDNFELFDADKTKIGFANVKIYDQPYTIPSGVKYVKFSVKDPDIDTAQFGVSQNSVYEPYNAIVNEFNIGDTITTLVGTNNVFADNGNISVTYKKSINDAIAELQALIL